MNRIVQPDNHIVIVGAGTFGLSTALELLRSGHKNLTIIDPYPIPSPLSAGNDVNKIVQTTVEDRFYSELALESLEKWRNDPIYKPAFHETGIIYGATGEDAIESIEQRKKFLKSKGKTIKSLNNPNDFAELIKFDQGLGSRFLNWKGYHQETDCGWTFAALALQNAGKECVKLGAKFVADSVEELLFNEKQVCLGVKTFSGKLISGDKIVICSGANSIRLLDFKNQLLAKCWTVGHIKLTKEESKLLKNSPVVLNIDEGFCFEPDLNNELKFCNEFPGYINMEKFKNIYTSVPSYKSLIPQEAENQMRGFLKQVFPSLATRDFTVAKICWCTDTPDRHFLFGQHPEHKNLILGTGDSGKGFKYMPVVGDYLAKMILFGDDSIDEEKKLAWKWRPLTNRDIYSLQNRYGGSNKVKDLKHLKKWSNGRHNRL